MVPLLRWPPSRLHSRAATGPPCVANGERIPLRRFRDQLRECGLVRFRAPTVQFFFADHMLDTDRRELRRGSEPIAVEPQVLDLLIYLVQRRPRRQQGRSHRRQSPKLHFLRVYRCPLDDCFRANLTLVPRWPHGRFRPHADPATDPRAILARFGGGASAAGYANEGSIPRGAHIRPSRSRRYIISRDGEGAAREPPPQELIDRAACRNSGALLSSVGQHELRHQITDAET